jgi:hypothetical protein
MKNIIYCCIIAVTIRNHFNHGYLVFDYFSQLTHLRKGNKISI